MTKQSVPPNFRVCHQLADHGLVKEIARQDPPAVFSDVLVAHECIFTGPVLERGAGGSARNVRSCNRRDVP